jgi:glutaredoxin
LIQDTGPVQIDTAASCGYCRRAKDYLGCNGIDFRNFNIESVEGMQAYARGGGSRGNPLFFARDRRLSRFIEAAYDEFFRGRP